MLHGDGTNVMIDVKVLVDHPVTINALLSLSTIACGAEYTWYADSTGVTHIVYPFGPNGDPDDGVQYMRVQDRRCSCHSCLAAFYVMMHQASTSCAYSHSTLAPLV